MVKEQAKQALARNLAIRISPRKLNLVAQSIRGLKLDAAVNQLTFSTRRVSGEVLKVLEAAIANAENNMGFDVDRLYVSEAYVGKAMVMKRFRARARGRSGKIKKFFSNLTVIVREKEDKEEKV